MDRRAQFFSNYPKIGEHATSGPILVRFSAPFQYSNNLGSLNYSLIPTHTFPKNLVKHFVFVDDHIVPKSNNINERIRIYIHINRTICIIGGSADQESQINKGNKVN